MKLTRLLGALCAAFISTTASASWDDHHAAFFAKDRGQVSAPSSAFGALPKRISRSNDLPIILSVTRKLGVPDDVAIPVCHVESRCTINGRPGPMTKHGRHYGAYQTRENVARRFGYTRAEGPLRGMVALKYGAMHLADCWRRSGRNRKLASLCHVSGPGALASRSRRPSMYARNYQTWVERAPKRIHIAMR